MDIYFQKEYGIINQYIEKGIAQEFVLNSQYGIIRNMFIKRTIPEQINGKTYFDIISPYGYGGPYIAECKEGCKKQLLDEYSDKFSQYCIDNDIVSEFIRFHPIMNNALDFKEIYSAQCIRKTVGTNLKDYDDPVKEEFSKSCKKNIKRAINAGVTWKVTENPKDLDIFIDIYYSTMKRNTAGNFYYFPKEYFDLFQQKLGKHILLVEAIYKGKTIAAGFYLAYKKIIHAHLSGTLEEYMSLSPAYVIKYATATWGKEHGYDLIHYGGGKTDDINDSLFQYKLKFTRNTFFDFFIGKKIWNVDVYRKLCKESNADENSTFFPAYRQV